MRRPGKPLEAQAYNPKQPRVEYISPKDAEKRDGETEEEYDRRVPFTFRPAKPIKVNYLGKELK